MHTTSDLDKAKLDLSKQLVNVTIAVILSVTLIVVFRSVQVLSIFMGVFSYLSAALSIGFAGKGQMLLSKGRSEASTCFNKQVIWLIMSFLLMLCCFLVNNAIWK